MKNIYWDSNKNLTLTDRISILFILVFKFSDLFELFPMDAYYNKKNNVVFLYEKFQLSHIIVVFSDSTETAKSLFVLSKQYTPNVSDHITSNSYFTQTVFQLGTAMWVGSPKDL